MKRLCSAAILAVTFFLLPLQARATELLIPVGQAVGLQLLDDTVTVAAFDEDCQTGRQAGLKIGDQIERINNIPVHSTQQVQSLLAESVSPARIAIRRGGKFQTLTVPLEDPPRLGVYLRQGISGIGTVTFYDPDSGLFGALGHGVSGGKGELLELRSGGAYALHLTSLIKGRAGDPGQLKGEADGEAQLGTLEKNTPQGVFGHSTRGWKGEPIPVADFEEIHTGPATIRCTVTQEGTQEYSVEILKIYPENRSDGRNLLLKVTDPTLLQETGGVVQGMSGSPIIQDGTIIGAVTHVLVNDPTRGYGIFIENMLEAAG